MKASGSSGAISRFTEEDPCPICGGHPAEPRGNGTRCFGFYSEDGVFAHCTREDMAGSLPVHENSSTYGHLLLGECRCGTKHDGLSTVVARYEYTDLAGNPVHRTVRHEPKDFSQERFEDGFWKSGLAGIRCVLYNWPGVIEAIRNGEPVPILEGEKDAETAKKLGFSGATTCAGGAKKWKDYYNDTLRGADVLLFPHNDPDGQEHARRVAEGLLPGVNDLKWVDLPGVGKGGDLSDWVEMGGTREALDKLIAETENIHPEIET
jgi:hypothetical protein